MTNCVFMRLAIVIDAENLRISDNSFKKYQNDPMEFMSFVILPIVHHHHEKHKFDHIHVSVELFDTIYGFSDERTRQISEFQSFMQSIGVVVHSFKLQKTNDRDLKKRQKGCDSYMTFRLCVLGHDPDVNFIAVVSGDGDFAPAILGINEECDNEKSVTVFAPSVSCLSRTISSLNGTLQIVVTDFDLERKKYDQAIKKGYIPLDPKKLILNSSDVCPRLDMYGNGIHYLKRITPVIQRHEMKKTTITDKTQHLPRSEPIIELDSSESESETTLQKKKRKRIVT